MTQAGAIYAHELRQAQRTSKDRVIWMQPNQTKVVIRAGSGEIIFAVWNKDRALRSSDMERLRLDASIPYNAQRIIATRDNWHGAIFRWLIDKRGHAL